MYALFVDFRAAFDKVDRVKMFECMRERERRISEWLVRTVEEIYTRTRNKVKVGEKEGEWFETRKGVRQGCPLSPHDIRGGRGRNVEGSTRGGERSWRAGRKFGAWRLRTTWRLWQRVRER
jgi:hypothetical protein